MTQLLRVARNPLQSSFEFGLQRWHNEPGHDLKRQLAMVRVVIIAGEDYYDQLVLQLNCKRLTSVSQAGNHGR
ncbi:MAG: hypothetical protein AAGD43_02020 [Pseudomonadota bacterium]